MNIMRDSKQEKWDSVSVSVSVCVSVRVNPVSVSESGYL